MAHADTASGHELPATAYTVLGLLSFGSELTGYDLRKWGQNLRFFYWSPAQSQVYTELRRLLVRGYVSERREQQEGRRLKLYYRITRDGEQAFRDWLQHGEVGPPIIKHSVMLRLFFGHRTDPARLREVLREYQSWLAEQREDLEKVRTSLLPDFPYPQIVAVWGDSFYAAESAAVDAVLTQLDQLPPGAPGS